jgi:hypothetical protein
MPQSTKLAYQGFIQDRYPELVRQYRQELCMVCNFHAFGYEGCDKDLLPVTIDGQRCPYFSNMCPSFHSAARARDPRKILTGRR